MNETLDRNDIGDQLDAACDWLFEYIGVHMNTNATPQQIANQVDEYYIGGYRGFVSDLIAYGFGTADMRNVKTNHLGDLH